MKNYTIVFTRDDVSGTFPESGSPSLVAHIKSTYASNPIKLIGMHNEISNDLLTLTITRQFATEADATQFSQDPIVLAWLAELPVQSAGITE